MSRVRSPARGRPHVVDNTSTDPGTVDAAISAHGHYLYVQTGANGIVDEFRINRDGSLTPIGSVIGFRRGRRRRHRRRLAGGFAPTGAFGACPLPLGIARLRYEPGAATSPWRRRGRRKRTNAHGECVRPHARLTGPLG